MALTTHDIAHRYMAALVKDKTLHAWALSNYSKVFSLHIGVDPRRKPTELQTPFIVIFTEGFERGQQGLRNSHSLGVVVGIRDEEIHLVHEWMEMRGMAKLSHELVPLLETIMSSAVRNTQLQEFSVDYADINFPLLQANIGVTVLDLRPVGLRNS